MRKPLKVVLGLVAVLVVSAIGTYAWAAMRSARLLARTFETHRVDFPIPFPLTADEVAALDPDDDPDVVALARAIERGSHLVNARYGCAECHGPTFGGGEMIVDPLVGSLLAPNLTSGTGSKILTYEPADWDRAVRHGVKPDGTPSVMPSVDFARMSDQELSDIVVFIESMPGVASQVPPVRLGPLSKFLIATGELEFFADIIESHEAPHESLPPLAEISVDFGRHLGAVCVGCHQANLAGGPIPGGDPSWPPAGNLTPHEQGLSGWSLADFRRVLVDGRLPDGTDVLEPMTLMQPAAANMTEVEMEALWTYLRSLPPTLTNP